MLKVIKLLFIIALALVTASEAIADPAAAIVGSHDIKHKLLFLRNGDIWAFDIENQSEVQITKSKHITHYCVSFDASKIAYLKELKKLYVFDMATGAEEFITDIAVDASQPSFSPLADKIALISLSKKEFEVGSKIDTTTLSNELKAYASEMTKPRKEKVRHVWIVDIKTKSLVDVTSDVPYQHSQLKWSPDGSRLSFASYRVGKDAYAGNKWQVYVMELNNPNHKTTVVSDSGMSSAWINNEEIVVSEGVATNTLSIYNIKTKIKKPFAAIRTGSSTPRFTLGGSQNEVIYYEEFATPEGHRDALIRSYNTHSDKAEDVVKDAVVPWYVK